MYQGDWTPSFANSGANIDVSTARLRILLERAQVLAVGNFISLLNEDSYKRGEVLKLHIVLHSLLLYLL